MSIFRNRLADNNNLIITNASGFWDAFQQFDKSLGYHDKVCRRILQRIVHFPGGKAIIYRNRYRAQTREC